MNRGIATEGMISQWKKQVDYCFEHIEKLGEGESKFIDSLSIQFEHENFFLTFYQSKWLRNIYNRLNGLA